MKNLRFNEWEIELDDEATKAYYGALTIPDIQSQDYRNYAAYCGMLSSEEKAFFDAMGITPEKCDVRTSGLDKGRSYPSFGSYIVLGRYLHVPLVEKFKYKDHSIKVGKYQFSFNHPDLPFPPRLKNIPVNAICIHFHAETIPWLLHERCKRKRLYPAKRWQILKRLYNKIQHRKSYKERVRWVQAKLVNMFDANHMVFIQMPKRKAAAYMRQWFRHFVPPEKQAEAYNTASRCGCQNGNSQNGSGSVSHLKNRLRSTRNSSRSGKSMGIFGTPLVHISPAFQRKQPCKLIPHSAAKNA